MLNIQFTIYKYSKSLKIVNWTLSIEHLIILK